jgi:hypothetical protein
MADMVVDFLWMGGQAVAGEALVVIVALGLLDVLS